MGSIMYYRTIFVIMHLQAHHLNLEFYDTFFKPGAYLRARAHEIVARGGAGLIWESTHCISPEGLM